MQIKSSGGNKCLSVEWKAGGPDICYSVSSLGSDNLSLHGESADETDSLWQGVRAEKKVQLDLRSLFPVVCSSHT
jgi:hypothetical protein